MKVMQAGVVGLEAGLLEVIQHLLMGDVHLLKRLHFEVDIALGAAAPLLNVHLDLKQTLL